MPTTYTIPVRPTGTDTKNIEGIVDDFDAILAALNDYDGGNIHAKTVPAGALILGSGQIYLGGAGGAAGMVTPKGDISGIDADGSFHIGNDKITAAMIAAGVVGASEIADGSVGNAELASDAVTQSKVADNAIGNAEMRDDAIGTAELIDLMVTGAKIANNTIGGGKLTLSVLSDAPPGDTSVGPAWTDIASVTPVANATYLVLAVGAWFGVTQEAKFRITVDGAAVWTADNMFATSTGDLLTGSILRVDTPTTTTPIKLQAFHTVTNATVKAHGLTRLVCIRIG